LNIKTLSGIEFWRKVPFSPNLQMVSNNEFQRYIRENNFIETTSYALSIGQIKISQERSWKIKQVDLGGHFSIKSTFAPALLQLAHDSNQN